MSRWRKLSAVSAAVAVVFLTPAGSTAAVEDGEGASGTPPAPAPVGADPFDGLDLSDPLAAREEVQRRLGESAATSEVLAGLVELGRAELQAAQERSASVNEWLETARGDAVDARNAVARAERVAGAAAERAVEARAIAREALVDAYMTPPSADGARVSVSLSLEDVNESSFAHGLLASRAENLTDVVEDAEDAEDAAERAEDAASRAVRSADAAAAEATAAVASAAAAAEETGRRLADLQMFEALAAARVESLVLVDALLGRVAEQRDAAADVAGGPPVPASEVSAVGGTTIRVHRSVVDAVSALIMSAAADGVVLNGFGWRTVESQIALRRAHCGASPAQIFLVPASTCSPPTARPGSSMHERGLAIDFADCASRTTACYQWLAANAHRFGFFNLPSEPWHWSVNGN
jgi:hypothetical protein